MRISDWSSDVCSSDLTNRRTDGFGGETASRIRLTADVVRAVRKSVGSNYVVGVRISQAKVNDFGHKWAGGEADAKVVFSHVADAGVDYIHTTEFDAGRPAFDDDGPSLEALASRTGGAPVIAHGWPGDPEQEGELGRGAG